MNHNSTVVFRALKNRILILAITIAAAPLLLAFSLQSNFTFIFANRVYRQVGASHIDWMGIPTGGQPTNLSDAEKNQCRDAPPVTIPTEIQTRAESSMAGNGKLLTWSADGTMFAFVARDPTIPLPTPNPWGCTDCFYPVLKISRASDMKVMTTIRLPDFSEDPSGHWNYAEAIAWSPDGKTLLVGAEAGISTSHFEDYWLLDWTHHNWRYVGGGNDAKWSSDSKQLLWSTARNLQTLGKIHVWATHLVLLDVQSLKQTAVTSGTSEVSDFHWCFP